MVTAYPGTISKIDSAQPEVDIIAAQLFHILENEEPRLRKAAQKLGLTFSEANRLVKMPRYARQYLESQEIAFDLEAEKIVDLTEKALPSTDKGGLDAAALGQVRLQVETRKWMLEKLAPRYSEIRDVIVRQLDKEQEKGSFVTVNEEKIKELGDDALKYLLDSKKTEHNPDKTQAQTVDHVD